MANAPPDLRVNCGCSSILLAGTILFVMFYGEPDLLDAIISWLMK